MSDRLIEAAGGVLWRPAPGGSGIEIALVHRPKYDDWSLPKGKLNPGEHVILGAVREVWEETGLVGVPGRPLGEIHYDKDGSPKRVRYWSMISDSGEFVPNAEVDQLMWLPPREAQRHLSPDRDQRIVAGLDRVSVMTRARLIVRHGSAGDRASWDGEDRDRPLDDRGIEQAEALVPLLSAYRVQRVLSADVVRCLETIGPYAEHAQLTVESEPLVSETGYPAQPELARERMLDIVCTDSVAVVSSQGKAIPGLVTSVCQTLDAVPPPEVSLRKGGVMVIHVAEGRPCRIVATERFDPLA